LGFHWQEGKARRETDDPTLGDVWTFCAIDAETKIVPTFRVGKRDHFTANAFVSDVASRLKNRPQVSSDGLRTYIEAMENAFGMNVDFGMVIKNYGADKGEHHQERRYSAPEVMSMQKIEVMGRPDPDLISTSHIERLNGTTRLHMRRLTRLTYAFSKRVENFEAAVAPHFAYYNLVKTHSTIRCTPAMAAGVEKSFLTVGDLVEAA
jgi:IS1 family transposase